MFGSHLSVAGGMINALHEAKRLRLDTVQVFTKNQRQWAAPPLDPGAAREWTDELRTLGWESRTVSHASYLINLASPDDTLWKRSIDAMLDEIERCEALSIPFLVHHPGAHLGQGVEAGIRRIAKAYARFFRQTRGYRTISCLENTAGGGSTLGRSFEELAQLKQAIDEECGGDAKGRVGFCIDTCHALAAGYDIACRPTPLPDPPAEIAGAKPARRARPAPPTGRKRTSAEGLALGEAMLAELDRVCGLAHARVFHLNDSLGARGSNIDRHAHIGQGQVAAGAFAAVMNHALAHAVPMILETPKGEDDGGRNWDSVNLARLRRLLNGAGAAGAPSESGARAPSPARHRAGSRKGQKAMPQ